MIRKKHCQTKSYLNFRFNNGAVTFLNEQLNDERVKFTCDKKNYLHLQLTEKDVEVTLFDNLGDMLAIKAHLAENAPSPVAFYVLCRVAFTSLHLLKC